MTINIFVLKGDLNGKIVVVSLFLSDILYTCLVQVQQTAQMVEYCYNKYGCWCGASVSDMHVCRCKFNRHDCLLGATVKGMANGRMQLL